MIVMLAFFLHGPAKCVIIVSFKQGSEDMYLSLATSLAFFVLKAMGLQTLAKNNEIKHGWLAWLPVLNQWVMCKMAGSHLIFKHVRTDHLFGYMFLGSSLMSLLFKNRTPIRMVLLLAVGLVWLYLTYVMFRDFYGRVLGKSSRKALVAMVVPPLDAVWIYSCRDMDRPVQPRPGMSC